MATPTAATMAPTSMIAVMLHHMRFASSTSLPSPSSLQWSWPGTTGWYRPPTGPPWGRAGRYGTDIAQAHLEGGGGGQEEEDGQGGRGHLDRVLGEVGEECGREWGGQSPDERSHDP